MKSPRPLLVAALAALGALAPLEAVRGEGTHRVPGGFVIEKVSGPEVVFPMFGALDDRGRLFVTESSGGDLYLELQKLVRECRVRVLEDRDGDGRFETSALFYEGLTPSMGLCWREGRLYVADPPDLVTLEDTDGDGAADRRTVVLTGFGHQDNGSLHGLTFGPDGLLYFTMGQPDGYRIPRGDGAVLEGRSGALLRCRADGSRPEVVSRGFQNLVEVAWTRAGDVIGTVNWFQEPRDGLRDALVHLADGGLYPYVPDAGTPQPVTGDALPPVSLSPAVALSGVARYRGAAFPSSYRDNLFTAQHNSRKVVRHILRRDASTFRSREEDFVTSADPDFRPSDVLEDADGSLLVVDTGSWYVHHCPTGRLRPTQAPGGIYRVRARDAGIADDPWGRRIDWPGLATARLAERLADPRPAVRDRAMRELVRREETAPLEHTLSRVGAQVKQRVAWVLAAIPGDAALEILRRLLTEREPGVAAAAARALGARRDARASPELSRLLSHTDAAARFAAAEALARSGAKGALPHLWKGLAEGPDRFLEHALGHAVYRLADARDLRAALAHSDARVQKIALLLLDQTPDGELSLEDVLPRLASSVPELREGALAVLQKHPEWGAEGAALVGAWLRKPELARDEEVALRGTILAFPAHGAMERVVAAGLRDVPSPQRLRLVLESIRDADIPRLSDDWRQALGAILQSGDASARREVIAVATVFGEAGFDTELAELAEDPRQSAALRLEALRARIARHPKLSDGALELLLAQFGNSAEPLLSLAAAQTIERAHLTDVQVARAVRAVRGHALISPGSLLSAFRESTGVDGSRSLLEALEGAALEGWTPRAADVERVRARLPAELADRTAALEKHLGDVEKGRRSRWVELDALVEGGDVERGRTLFFATTTACATCHSVGEAGGRIGPDLTKIGAVRTRRDLLESILFPASTLAQGYETHVVVLRDGTVRSGILERQTPEAIVLVDGSGRKERIATGEVLELGRAAASLMPEGLERVLTREELGDLLAFLQSLR